MNRHPSGRTCALALLAVPLAISRAVLAAWVVRGMGGAR